jgi:cyclase
MPTVPDPTLEEVAPGVFAYLQLHGQWGLNNAGFILPRNVGQGPSPDGGGVVVIDTCFTERRSRAFADAVHRTAGTERPVQTLINTHHHGDHTHGNSVFGPGTTIVAHEKCREELLATGLGTKALWPDTDWGDLQLAPPNVTFRHNLTVHAGDTRIELIYVGPAHTTNDIVAWLPDQRVLYAGDVVFNGGTPFVVMGSVAGSLEALGALRRLDPQVIVPGHGSVCSPAVLYEIESYLNFVWDTAKRGFNAGVSPLETARDTDLGPFADLHDSERFVANLHRAYSELRGEPRGAPIGLGAVMPDMIAYNGGKVPECLA